VARKPKYPAIDLGPLPVDAINAVLGTELEPGTVRLSEIAHRHMAEDHAADYRDCIASIQLAISDPSFIGQAPKRINNFEMLRRIRRNDNKVVLVAVGMEMDQDGDYRVKSCYLVAGEDVENRRQAGRLKPPPPK
jgi:phage-Barnase-EndoU-ColicinE5/D-RelE like nuclease3